MVIFFFFKQKTAYELVSRDWSSDVCSSDPDELSGCVGDGFTDNFAIQKDFDSLLRLGCSSDHGLTVAVDTHDIETWTCGSFLHPIWVLIRGQRPATVKGPNLRITHVGGGSRFALARRSGCNLVV